MKFVIDRSKWRCGGEGETSRIGKGDTQLMNAEGFMCCLGQVACQLGVDPEALDMLGEPEEIKAYEDIDILAWEAYERESGPPQRRNTPLSVKAMTINDDEHKTIEEREADLVALFAGEGHELVFAGEAVTP